ncbi:hypothetical protein K443DRAFT_429384 [Laccaria amethystina LaAM-08-1]|uniref:Uncharacterized protein n=1 Tax=Laccaria amethystina LaAM-08-1 TaxID=1095629 RepID=A0A0C9WP62_9AGAR|nr:hypothetical protein K443DRAFT_429384 [Laccaria amethystina LaAM-08-1]
MSFDSSNFRGQERPSPLVACEKRRTMTKLNRTRVYNPNVDREAASSGIPSSYRWRIAEYPPRRNMNPHARRMRGPRQSTIRPPNWAAGVYTN